MAFVQTVTEYADFKDIIMEVEIKTAIEQGLVIGIITLLDIISITL